MSETLKLDYFYGIESAQFKFYQVPKILFTDIRFHDLSSDAKLAYGLLLDRMSLSLKNNWFDKYNRAYIIYSLNDLAEDLGCSTDKAAKIYNSLDVKKGIGLIEKVRIGQGHPDLIYVKNFATLTSPDDEKKNEPEDDNLEKTTLNFNKKKAVTPCNSLDAAKNGFKKPQTDTRPQKTDSSDRKKQFPETENYETNNTYITDTDINDTEILSSPYNPSPSYKGREEWEGNDRPTPIVLTFGKRENKKTDSQPHTAPKKQTLKEKYVNYLRRNLYYDDLSLMDEYKDDIPTIDGIINMIADIASATSTEGKIWINSTQLEHEAVKSHLLKLNPAALSEALNGLRENKNRIAKPRSYILTTVYNAIDNHDVTLSSRVKNDWFNHPIN